MPQPRDKKADFDSQNGPVNPVEALNLNLDLKLEDEKAMESIDSLMKSMQLDLSELPDAPAEQPAERAVDGARVASGIQDPLGLIQGGADYAPGPPAAEALRIVPTIPRQFALGASGAAHSAATILPDQEKSELEKVKGLLERMKGDNPPTPRELGTIQSTKGKYYISQAINAQKDDEKWKGVMGELDAEIAGASGSAESHRMAASSAKQEIDDLMPENPTFIEQAVSSAAQSALPTVGALLLAPLVGPAPAIGLAAGSGFAMAAGDAYTRAEEWAKQKGIELTPEQKLRVGTVAGSLEFLGEFASMKIALKVGRPLFEHLAKVLVGESSSEAATSLMQDAAEAIQYNPDLTFKDFAYNAALSATAGAIGGAAIGPASRGMQIVGEKIQEQKLNAAIEQLISSEVPPILSAEQEAIRRLDPKEGGTPIESFASPTESFKAALKQSPQEAARIAESLTQMRQRGEDIEMPLIIAKRALDLGQITQKQMADFRRALIAREHKQFEADERASIEKVEESARIQQRMVSSAGDDTYTPTEEELRDLQFVRDSEEQANDNNPSLQEVAEYYQLQAPDTPLGNAIRNMASALPIPGSRDATSWEMNDRIDFKEMTGLDTYDKDMPPNLYERAMARALPVYFRVLAERQARGLYPFAASTNKWATSLDNWAPGIIWDRLDSSQTPVAERGEVVTKFSNPDLGRRAGQVLQEWVKGIIPTAKLYLIDEDGSRRTKFPIGDGGVEGWQATLGPDEGMIAISTRGREEPHMIEVMGHEFGHFIGKHLLARMPEKVQEAVWLAWARDTMRQSRGKLKDMMRERRGPLGQESHDVARPSQPLRNTAWNDPAVRSYLMGWEEWKAHQMERGVTMGEWGTAGPVRTFFKKWEAQLKKFFDKYGRDFAPNQTFKDFVQAGALMEQAKAEGVRRVRGVQEAMKKYGIEELDESEQLSVLDGLNKALARMDASVELQENLQQAAPELQQRALHAMKRIGLTETSLLTPHEGSPYKPSAEEYVASIEDAWLPGQGTDVPLLNFSKQPLPKSLPAKRMASFVRHALGPRMPDDSGYEGHLDRYNWFVKTLFTLEQLVKINPHIDQLVRYLERVREWARDRMAWISRADERLRQWRKLPNKQQQLLTRFMIDQTLEGKFFNMQDPQVLQKYPLDPQAQEMYERIKTDFIDFIAAVEGALVANAAKRLQGNPIAAATEINRIRDRFAELKRRPYFPLTRFGKFTVTVTATGHMRVGGQHYAPGEVVHFETFDTRMERAAELERIKRQYPNATVQESAASEAVQGLMGLPTPILEAVKSNPDIALTPDQKKALDEYMYKIAPGQSFVKHLIRRKGVEGYSEDAMRAYANYFFHGASHLARIKHVEALSEEIKAIDITAKLIEHDSTKRVLIADHMRRHFDFIMHPKNDWAAVRAAAAVAYLAGILKTAYINLTQVPLVTFPHLAAKYGDGAALRALQKAYGDAWSMYHVTKGLTKQEEEAISRWVQGVPPQPGDAKILKHWSKFTPDELTALRQAVSDGFIDESQAMELAAMSEGSWLTRARATSKVGYAARTLSQYGMIPFQAAEKLNRRVTFIAAYRLARQRGMGETEAYAAGREAVSASQYEYAKWNRPELLRGKKGVFFLFWQYMLNTMFFAMGGDKGWWRWWLLMLAAAGPMGLPFAENLMDLATWILSKDDKRVDARYEMKKKAKELAEVVGVHPDLLMHGVSRFGFGMVPFADLSGSLSMGRIVPGTELMASPGDKWDHFVTRGIEEAGGASAALVMRMLQASVSNDPDVMRRIEKGMPVTLARQMMQAARWYERDAAQRRDGSNLVEFDTNDPWDLATLAAKGLGGFQPRDVNAAYEADRVKRDFARFYELRREMLRNKLDEELENGDRESVAKVIEAIRKYNSQVPVGTLAITPRQIAQSRRAREERRARQNAGMAPEKRQEPLFRLIDEGKL